MDRVYQVELLNDSQNSLQEGSGQVLSLTAFKVGNSSSE